jgi:hypothetical protein
MVRIIKEGKKPEDDEYTCTCGRCGCEFEFQKKEAKMESDYRETRMTIECPCCKMTCYNAKKK